MILFISVMLSILFLVWCAYSGYKFGLLVLPINTILGFGVGWIIGQLWN